MPPPIGWVGGWGGDPMPTCYSRRPFCLPVGPENINFGLRFLNASPELELWGGNPMSTCSHSRHPTRVPVPESIERGPSTHLSEMVENSPLDSAETKIVTPLNFPVFKAKTKDSVFRQRFAVPLVNKDAGARNPFRPAPASGIGRVSILLPNRYTLQRSK